MREVQGQSAPFSVSQAMNMAKGALESIVVRIVGEVSEVSVKPGYKAAYFTIKDSAASLPCMMWNNRYRDSGVQLAVGNLVEVTGKFTLYAAKGRMNFDVMSLSLSGEGELRLRVANIAKRLQAEGLTAPERKRIIPTMPQCIGVVTSPRSAAVHDVLRTLRRRFPVADVLLAGVPVEGAQAPEGIMQGITCVANAGAQVVLVVRGGGSFEDLMPFNDERLARCIAACPVPVVTGIGHEVDTTIADMVSDYRASTPTAAAEAVSPSSEALSEYLGSRGNALAHAMENTLSRNRARLEAYSSRAVLKDPLSLLRADAQALDNASERLELVLPAMVMRSREQLKLETQALLREGTRLVKRFDDEIARGAARLEDLSPLGTLARGYSITRNEAGEIVREVKQAPVGSIVRIDVTDGTLECSVETINKR